MAGGADWIHEGDKDSYYCYTTGSEENGDLKHWRRREICIHISKPVPVADISVAGGDLGKTSKSVVFFVEGGQIKTFTTDSRILVCVNDEKGREKEYDAFRRRRQTWMLVGKDAEYDPVTGEDV